MCIPRPPISAAALQTCAGVIWLNVRVHLQMMHAIAGLHCQYYTWERSNQYKPAAGCPAQAILVYHALSTSFFMRFMSNFGLHACMQWCKICMYTMQCRMVIIEMIKIILISSMKRINEFSCSMSHEYTLFLISSRFAQAILDQDIDVHMVCAHACRILPRHPRPQYPIELDISQYC